MAHADQVETLGTVGKPSQVIKGDYQVLDTARTAEASPVDRSA